MALTIPEGIAPRTDDVAVDPGKVIMRLRDSGKQMEALPILNNALKEGSPHREDPMLWYACAILMADAHEHEKARLALCEMLKFSPTSPDPYLWLAQTEGACGRYQEAWKTLRVALDRCDELDLSNTHGLRMACWSEMAGLAYRQGKVSMGSQLYRQVINAETSELPKASHFMLGENRLRVLHDHHAWELYEARLGTVGLYVWDTWHRPTEPRWDGKAKGRVVFWQEQGAGDFIMMMRFIPWIAQQSGHRVTVRCDPPLWELTKAIPSVGMVVGRTDPVSCDYELPILSAPTVYGVNGWGTVPPPVRPDLPFNKRLGRPPKVKRIGVAWSGAKGHANDKDRSAPVDSLMTLRERIPATFYAMQPGDCPDWMVPLVTSDYVGTARAMSKMDAIVTVDSSPLHLAATLGIPTWTVLPAAPEWRWGLTDESRHAWYPKLNVVMRTRVNDWVGAWRRVAEQVNAYLATT